MKHERCVMREQGSGAIVNCSSISGLIGLPERAAYHGTKHAVLGMLGFSVLVVANTANLIANFCVEGRLF
jgi:NADP-dependent 3-hydroxy acid dehydrogenase YdfG